MQSNATLRPGVIVATDRGGCTDAAAEVDDDGINHPHPRTSHIPGPPHLHVATVGIVPSMQQTCLV